MSCAAGRSIVKTAPVPGRLSTRIVPPWLETTCRAMLNPKPEPLPCAFVVTHGSKM